MLPIISAELPGSVRVTPIYDRSQTIVNSVDDVQATLLIAFVLVVAVIFVFLGRATDTLIPAVALPLSLLLTFMAMRLLGYSLDNLSLMALTLAIGFLVDDAIVFLENTVRLMERGMKALEATLESAREISFTILSMTISLAAVFLPAGVHVRPGGPHLPRIRHHHRRFHLRFRTGVADADSADVREAPEGPRARHQAELDRADVGPDREARSRRLWQVAVVVPASSLDFRADVGRLHGGHGSAFYRRSQGVPARRRQQLHLGRDDREGRFIARADARLAGSGGSRAAAGSQRRRDVYDDREQPVPRVQSRLAAGVSGAAAGARRRFKPWRAD